MSNTNEYMIVSISSGIVVLATPDEIKKVPEPKNINLFSPGDTITLSENGEFTPVIMRMKKDSTKVNVKANPSEEFVRMICSKN